MNISWCKVDVNVSVSVTIIRTWIWNSSHIDGCLLRWQEQMRNIQHFQIFFHVPNTFWWLLNFERYVHVYLSFRCIFLICSCHLSNHPSICGLFHILMMVTETETLTSTLHHDIFPYLDYIFFLQPSYIYIYIYIYILIARVILLRWDHTSTTVWMHHVNFDKAFAKKNWLELRKNAACSFEENLGAVTKKYLLDSHLPPI